MATKTTTDKRRGKIVEALEAKGIDPTEEAIEGVRQEMVGRNILYSTAVNRWLKKTEQDTPKKRGTTRSQTYGQSAGQNTAGKLDAIARDMADGMKRVVGAKAVSYLFEDLQRGDLGEFFDEALEDGFSAFQQTLEADFLAIESAESEPYCLPASASTSSTTAVSVTPDPER